MSLKEPLTRFMYIGKYKAKVIHYGQNKVSKPKCSKCLSTGHTIDTCVFDWTCMRCKTPGHRKGDCPMNISDADETCEVGATGGASKTPLSADSIQPADDSSNSMAPKGNDGNARDSTRTPAGTPCTSPVRTTPKRKVTKNNKVRPQKVKRVLISS